MCVCVCVCESCCKQWFFKTKADVPHGKRRVFIGFIYENPIMGLYMCKNRENFNFLKKGKMVILVKIRNFSRSRMMKRTLPLESSREI